MYLFERSKYCPTGEDLANSCAPLAWYWPHLLLEVGVAYFERSRSGFAGQRPWIGSSALAGLIPFAAQTSIKILCTAIVVAAHSIL